MKITRRKLKKLIEAFISGPKGTINLDAEPYEFMQGHDNPKIANLAKDAPESAIELAGAFDPSYIKMKDYEDEVRNNNNFDKKSHAKDKPTSDVYARTMMLYDSGPNFEANLKKKVFDHIGEDLNQKAKELLDNHEVGSNKFNDYDTVDYEYDPDEIVEYEVMYFLEDLAAIDRRFDMHDETPADREALNAIGRKSIRQIVMNAYRESGLYMALDNEFNRYVL